MGVEGRTSSTHAGSTKINIELFVQIVLVLPYMLGVLYNFVSLDLRIYKKFDVHSRMVE